MVENAYRGEVPLQVGDATYTLRYAWREIAEMRTQKLIGDSGLLFGAEHPEALAKALVIGARRSHPDVHVNVFMDSGLPLLGAMAAVTEALNYAFWGGTQRPDPTQPATIGGNVAT